MSGKCGRKGPLVYPRIVVHFHVVVWIDHPVAQINQLGCDGTSREFLKSANPRHIHHKAGTVGKGHEGDKPTFFCEIAAHLTEAGAILIVGRAETKSESNAFLQVPAVAGKVIGMEPPDAESEGEVIAFAHKAFVRSQRMTPPR
jgi:hypothetical protein